MSLNRIVRTILAIPPLSLIRFQIPSLRSQAASKLSRIYHIISFCQPLTYIDEKSYHIRNL